MNPQFLFGYGSLINQASRALTGITKNPLAVKVSGFERSWCVQAPAMRLTGLGVIPNPLAWCNGVLVELDQDQIMAFDERELGGSNAGYARVEIPRKAITGLHAPETGRIWTYVVKKILSPTKAYPITQSYLDVILSGCLDFGEPFALDFIQTTAGWEHPWMDDRQAPRYVRHLRDDKLNIKVDDLLKQTLGLSFAQRTTGF